MALMLAKTYAAFKAAGVDEDQAQAAAEELAAFETRFASMESSITAIEGKITGIESKITAIEGKFGVLLWAGGDQCRRDYRHPWRAAASRMSSRNPRNIGGSDMEKFTTLTGIAAPLPMINVDTDKILPAVYLKTIERTGLGKVLFDEIRYRPDGSENPDFVLNRPPWREAKILVAGDNFGCGSSREHAPWALLDFGIRCVVAPSFADIFYNNCFKNGLLPIALPQALVDQLMEDAQKGANAVLSIDLEQQTISRPDGAILRFDIDPFRKHCLLHGLDDIALTEQKAPAIARYEAEQRAARPWLRGLTRAEA